MTALRALRSRMAALLLALLVMVAGGLVATGSSALAGTGLVYHAVDSDNDPYSGIYLRNGTSMGSVDRVYSRYMVYGNSFELNCGAWGESVGPYANRRWHNVLVLNGPAAGQIGWVADRYADTPNKANQLTPGEPECGQAAPPPPPPAGGAVYFQPRWTSGDPYPTDDVLTISKDKWSYNVTKAVTKADCKTDRVDDNVPATVGGKLVTTMGTWSVSRLAPIYMIEQNFDLAKKFNFIVMYDPGSYANFFDPNGCDQFFDESGYLAKWLGASNNNVLMILAGRDTYDPNWLGQGSHQGIQQKLFPKIRGNKQLSSQVYVCNYESMPHPDVLWNFRSVMSNGRTTACPQGISAWHP
jgi:hypothetical protein